jgi:hypothetical protein
MPRYVDREPGAALVLGGAAASTGGETGAEYEPQSCTVWPTILPMSPGLPRRLVS